MGKKNTKRQLKKEQRAREAEDRAAAVAEFEARKRRYRVACVVVPVVAFGAALGIYYGFDDKQLAGLVGLIGVAVWVLVLLAAVGLTIKPRDRSRAGSIDFGSGRCACRSTRCATRSCARPATRRWW